MLNRGEGLLLLCQRQRGPSHPSAPLLWALSGTGRTAGIQTLGGFEFGGAVGKGLGAQNNNHRPCGRTFWMVVSTVNLFSCHNAAPRQPMDRLTLALPQVGICDGRDPARLFSGRTHSSPALQGMGVVTPDIAQQELVGGAGGF